MQTLKILRSLALAGLAMSCGDESPEPETGLLRALPFELERPSRGAPITDEERVEATQLVTSFLKASNYFGWVKDTSHGVHASTGKRDYALWWHDVDAVKEGSRVTFRHSASGGAHNVYIPTSRVLAAAAVGYLATQDPEMAWVAEQYSKAITASIRGFVHDANDPNRYLMARNIVNRNHEYTLADGRQVAVDYEPWYSTYEDWNAQRLHYPENPDWGDIYVTNMRSKDDLPHIYAAAPWLLYLSEDAEDSAVREAAREAFDNLAGFARDIVDSGYLIRTKDAEGRPFVPTEDLASFVRYESLIPNAECAAKLGSALIGRAEPHGNQCGFNGGNDYDGIATSVHYYNYDIVQIFHVAAISLALARREIDAAKDLLTGMILRVERYRDPETKETGASSTRWPSDVALLMLRAAAVGYPLTDDEARQVMTELAKAAEHYRGWPRWNLWDASVPDGVYDHGSGYRPSDESKFLSIDTMGLVFEYCGSPLRSPKGVAPVDCARVLDRSRWGE
ncbi:MAG: hypothetical protein HYV07_15030 [Deltaproteobacteria bacterium]|nr:hypothetical protein [Deltaproteobacteria bacterium]